jgi:hypothetical protein
MFTVTLFTLVTMIFRPKIFSEFHHFIFWVSLMLIMQVLVWRWCTSCDVFHDNPETCPTVIWLCTLYISFSVCVPYMLCTLYWQCEPFCCSNIWCKPKFFIHQQMHFLWILANSKIYIKTYIKIAPGGRWDLTWHLKG